MEKLQEYGKVGIITHLALSWTFFAGTYLAVNRTKNPEKILKFLKLENKVPAKAGSFVISGIIYKAVMPARIALSLLCIPIVIKVLDINVEKKSEHLPPVVETVEEVVA
jgi:hypothetical protein